MNHLEVCSQHATGSRILVKWHCNEISHLALSFVSHQYHFHHCVLSPVGVGHCRHSPCCIYVAS